MWFDNEKPGRFKRMRTAPKPPPPPPPPKRDRETLHLRGCELIEKGSMNGRTIYEVNAPGVCMLVKEIS